ERVDAAVAVAEDRSEAPAVLEVGELGLRLAARPDPLRVAPEERGVVMHGDRPPLLPDAPVGVGDAEPQRDRVRLARLQGLVLGEREPLLPERARDLAQIDRPEPAGEGLLAAALARCLELAVARFGAGRELERVAEVLRARGGDVP